MFLCACVKKRRTETSFCVFLFLYWELMRLLTPLSFFFVCVCVFVELLPNGTNVHVPLFFFTFFLRVVHNIYFSIFPPFAFFFLPGKRIDSVITQFLVQRKS